MNIKQRLRAFFGLPETPTGFVANQQLVDFIEQMQHQEGNAVQIKVLRPTFTEDNVGDLLAEDFIYHWMYDQDGNYILFSDKDRLSRFDLDVLDKLVSMQLVEQCTNRWWE